MQQYINGLTAVCNNSASIVVYMKLLLTISDYDVVSGVTKIDEVSFKERRAVRAVTFGEGGKIYLLRVSKHEYHKLPGGGVKKDEEDLDALSRELMEEIGCKAKVVSELGQIVEYRNRWKLKQTSMGYITAQHGKQTSQSLEQSEIDEGHEIVMANDVEDAITILESDAPKNYEGKFIVKRDIAFLVAARDAQNNV